MSRLLTQKANIQTFFSSFCALQTWHSHYWKQKSFNYFNFKQLGNHLMSQPVAWDNTEKLEYSMHYYPKTHQHSVIICKPYAGSKTRSLPMQSTLTKQTRFNHIAITTDNRLITILTSHITGCISLEQCGTMLAPMTLWTVWKYNKKEQKTWKNTVGIYSI